MQTAEQGLGIRTVLNRTTRLATTRSSDCARHGSLLKSIQSSNFGETTNSMPSAPVLREASKIRLRRATLLSKAQRRNLPNFRPPTERYQASDLRISTTRIR